MSTTRIEKAARLISQGKVRPIQARSFVIEGDSGTYFVSVATEQPGGNVRDASCTCVFSRTAPIVKGDCSHVEAARAMLLMEEREAGGVTYFCVTCNQDVTSTRDEHPHPQHIVEHSKAQAARAQNDAVRADMRVVFVDQPEFEAVEIRTVSDGALLGTVYAPVEIGRWMWRQTKGHGVIELICNPDGRERTDG